LQTDGQLLGRYAAGGEEEAFAELIRRHGPMVRAVSSRLAGPDAEDAEQAVFILLARRAGRLKGRRDVGAWLHAACRLVARTARRERSRRAAREKEAAAMKRAGQEQELTPRVREELKRHLDAEVGALPERFRRVVTLCHLEGASQQEAAERLGLPLGTVATRSRRGLERLRRRLERRGIAPGAAALAAFLAEGAAAASKGFDAGALLSSVLGASQSTAAGAAAGAAGSGAVFLAKGAAKAMFWIKIKSAAAVLAATTVAAAAVPLGAAAAGSVGPDRVGEELGGQPPAPAQADGARVEVFTDDESGAAAAADGKEVARATARADLILIAKIKDAKPAPGQKKVLVQGDPDVNRPLIAARLGEKKLVEATAVKVLKGDAATKAVTVEMRVSGSGDAQKVVIAKTVRQKIDGRSLTMTRSFAVPFEVKAGARALMFLKLLREEPGDEGTTHRIYGLVPPLAGAGDRGALGQVGKTLKLLAAWENPPEPATGEAERIARLVARLGSEDFRTRDSATKDLVAAGIPAKKSLERAVASDDAEVAKRAGEILEAIKPDCLKEETIEGCSTFGNGIQMQAGGAGAIQMQVEMKAGE
jgi:RNA polymerase sigma factor (sigma-70 family)